MSTDPSPFTDAALIKLAIETYDESIGAVDVIEALAAAEETRLRALQPAVPPLPRSAWQALESIFWGCVLLACFWIYFNR